MYEKGIVIIGGGHGGSEAAAGLRSEGYDGKVTLVCNEPDIPYQRPPLSKAFLKDPDHQLLPLRAEVFYTKNDIELRLGQAATAIDRNGGAVALADGSSIPADRVILATGSRPRVPPVSGIDLEGVYTLRTATRNGGAVALADGSSIPADRVILATGSRPRVPPVSGIDLEGVYTLRTATDARRLRDAVHRASDCVVVGGGFIGLEIAGTARLLGKTVTVLEAAGRLMGRAVAPEISEHFLHLHRGWGSDIRLETPVGSFVADGGGLVGVETATGARIAADIAIVGIGAVPDMALAEAAGLDCDDGILVNDYVETSTPEILAIGDVVSFTHWELERRIRLESVQNAVDQGRVAARTIVGKREPYRDVPWFWSDQGDVKLQMAGLPFGASQSLLRGDMASGSFSVFHYDEDRLVAVDSVNRAGDHVVGRRLIGAGLSPPPEIATDEATNLKKLLKEMMGRDRIAMGGGS